MTRRTILAALCAMLLAAALPIPRACPGGAHAQDFSPKPFHELAQRVTDRYEGRLIAVRMMPPTPHERELGAALVYEFRLLTPHRNLLVICLDARTGRFLEVAGRGQLQALRPHREDRNEPGDDD